MKQSLARSRRYRHVCAPAVERFAREALEAAGGDARAAQKRVKTALHQVYGAFLPTTPRYDRLLAELRDSEDPAALREKLCNCMALHASTRERLPILDEFWSQVISRTGPAPRLLDIGCGLNPLAAPWMEGLADACYLGVELDLRLVEFLRGALDLLGVSHDLRVDDVLGGGAALPEADVALALKLLPTLEQQRSGSGFGLLDAIRAPIVVVSFPRQSLGGSAKGMTETYGRAFDAELEKRRWEAERIALPGELVYVVRK